MIYNLSICPITHISLQNESYFHCFVFTARCYAERGTAIACRLSVCNGQLDNLLAHASPEIPTHLQSTSAPLAG